MTAEGKSWRALKHAVSTAYGWVGEPAGHLQIISTLTVLERSIRTEAMPDKKAMREIYGRICPLDDGLPHIDSTNLLRSSRWNI